MRKTKRYYVDEKGNMIGYNKGRLSASAQD